MVGVECLLFMRIMHFNYHFWARKSVAFHESFLAFFETKRVCHELGHLEFFLRLLHSQGSMMVTLVQCCAR